MATTTYLSNPTVLVGAVDLSDQCKSATITWGYDQLETTAFGDSGHKFTKGLQKVEVSLTLFNSYGAGEVEASLYAVVGADATTVTLQAAAGAEGPSNPKWVCSGMFLAEFTPINASVGELSEIEVTFVGGTAVRDITP